MSEKKEIKECNIGDKIKIIQSNGQYLIGILEGIMIRGCQLHGEPMLEYHFRRITKSGKIKRIIYGENQLVEVKTFNQKLEG